MKKPLAIFSDGNLSNILEIRSFLMKKMYRNWKNKYYDYLKQKGVRFV